MWTQILVYVLLTLFALCYAAMGSYIADIFGDGKSIFKKYLIGLFWPIILFAVILIFGVIFIIVFIAIIVFILILLFNICKSLIKGEKIDWDKPIF